MKKRAFPKLLLLLLCLVLLLSSCGSYWRTVALLERELSVYENRFQQVAAAHQLEWSVMYRTKDYSEFYKATMYSNYYEAKRSKTEYIKIRTSGAVYAKKVNSPRFTVAYILPREKNKEFDTALFVDLVNCAAEVVLTLDFCNEFIAAPEAEYSDKDNEPPDSLSHKAYYYKPYLLDGPMLILREYEDCWKLIFLDQMRKLQ